MGKEMERGGNGHGFMGEYDRLLLKVAVTHDVVEAIRPFQPDRSSLSIRISPNLNPPCQRRRLLTECILPQLPTVLIKKM